MNGLANFAIRYRRWIMVFWLAALIVGGATSGTATKRLTTDFSLPGQPGYETSAKILQQYGNGGSVQPYIPVVTVPAGQTVKQNQAKIDAVFAEISTKVPGTRLVDYSMTKNDVFLTKDNMTTYALVYTPLPMGFGGVTPDKAIQPILTQATATTGLQWSLTGYYLLSAGSSDTSDAPSVLTETLLGALGALAVLIFVFASFLAILPLIIAAVSIMSTFLIVLGLTYITDMSFIVQFLIALVGLGVAVDYSLLYVTRWREELDHGKENREAVRESMRTAGRAVISSAGTVAISLMALLVIPVPFLRSIGLGGMLIPVVSTIVVLTLLPAMLAAVGPKIDKPKIRHESKASRGWTAWARLVVRRRWIAAGAALLILGILIAPLFGIKIGQTQTSSLANSGPAYTALQTLKSGGVPDGVVSPLEILINGSSSAAGAEQAAQASVGVDGVSAAFAPTTPQWQKPNSAIANAIPTNESVDSTNAAVVNRVTDATKSIPGWVGVAGAGAIVLDYINAVYANFPLVLLLIALVTFVLLARAFRSLLLAGKAVVLNLISVAATFGATVWFWQEGHGSEALFNIDATGAITFWLPVMIFAFLFGLSMDYEVFILARMREEYDKSGSTKEAVIQGLGRTGRLVTCAALILFMAFIALLGSPGTDIKVFATALGIGILLDATVVRALLVPALVSLFGRWNWYLPVWAAKILRTEPHAAIPEPVETSS